MRKTLLFAMLFASNANADCNPVVNLASYHFDRTEQHNERNYGLGVECGRWSIGQYKNSEYGQTQYVFYNFPITENFGVLTGVVRGYTYKEYMPIAALSIRYSVLRFAVVPPIRVDGKNRGLIGMQIVIPINP